MQHNYSHADLICDAGEVENGEIEHFSLWYSSESGTLGGFFRAATDSLSYLYFVHIEMMILGLCALIVIIAVIGVGGWLWSAIGKKNDEQSRLDLEKTHYGSSDHDDTKRQYASRDEAREVIRRMQWQGCDLLYRLKAYYNPKYKNWFVGRFHVDS